MGLLEILEPTMTSIIVAASLHVFWKNWKKKEHPNMVYTVLNLTFCWFYKISSSDSPHFSVLLWGNAKRNHWNAFLGIIRSRWGVNEKQFVEWGLKMPLFLCRRKGNGVCKSLVCVWTCTLYITVQNTWLHACVHASQCAFAIDSLCMWTYMCVWIFNAESLIFI